MRKLTLSTIVMLLAAFLLIGCGGSDDGGSADAGDSGSSAATLDIVMNDIYFGDENDNIANPPTWTVDVGSSVRVSAENAGALEHNWAIVEQGATLPDAINDPAEVEDLIIFDIGNVAGGDSTSSRLPDLDAGTYTIICTVAGHYPAMQGILQVNG